MSANGINLLPEDIRRKRRLRTIRRYLYAAGALYAVALVAAFAMQRLELGEKKAELASLQAELQEASAGASGYPELARKLSEIRSAEAELSRRLGAVAGLSEGRVEWSYLLKRLSIDTPKGVWLRSIATSDDAGGKKVRLLGGASSNRSLAEFISTLERSGYLEGVSLTYSQKRGDSETYDFELGMVLSKTKAGASHGS